MDRILLIEDSKFFANVVSKGFKKYNDIEPVIATCLAEAEHLISTGPDQFVLALVDVRLPDALEGEAIDSTLAANIPTVVYTSNFNDDIRDAYLAKGVLDFVLKDNPSGLDYLIQLAHRIVRNRSVKVLVVDDSTVARQYCSSWLLRYQLNVLESKDGEEALIALQHDPDIRLIITDHEMPKMNGFELVTELRRKHSRDKLAVIGVSGSGGATLSARFLKHGANDFIAKPYLPEELYTRVAITLDTLDSIERLEFAATRDFLTGLYNRRSFFDFGARSTSMWRRSNTGCAIAMIDIDHFKSVNDSYGHDAGDAVLKSVAETLERQTLRGGDICARLGGEEFAILLDTEEPGKIEPYFQEMRSKIEAAQTKVNGKTIQVTASFGVTVSQKPSFETMLKAADQNLYKAKQNGRNCVVISQQD